MYLKTTGFVDPALRGLVLCLMTLEEEAQALGQPMAASLIATARLALLEPNGSNADSETAWRAGHGEVVVLRRPATLPGSRSKAQLA